MKVYQFLHKIVYNRRFVYLLLIVITLAIYFKSIFFKFTFLDDDLLLIGRQEFLGNFSNILKSFQEPVFYLVNTGSNYYRPILNVFFIIEYKIFGSGFWGYHLFNLLLHILNVLLVYVLFTKLDIKKNISFVSAILFAVHPLLTQAVVWVPGINDLLLALFFLSSMIYLIDFLKTKYIKDLFFFLLFFALSLFVKESAILFFFIFVSYYVLFATKKSTKIFLIIFFPSTLISLLYFFLRSKAIGIDVTSGWIFNSIQNNFIGGIIVNLGKILFPFNLSVLPILEKSSNLIWGLLSVLIIISLLIFSKKKKLKFILLGLLIFLFTFLPTLVNPNSKEPLVMFEHRLYIPLIGFILIINNTSIFIKYFVEKKIYIPVCFLLFLISFSHINKFKDSVSFWEDANSKSGNFFYAKANLALVYYMNGNTDQAKKLLLKLETEKYNNAFVHNNLGVIYEREGNFDQAIEEFNKALKIDRFSSKSYLNLGYIYKYQNNIQKAKDYFRYAIFTDEDNVEAMMNLASLYLDEGNTQKAQLIYDEVKKRGVSY